MVLMYTLQLDWVTVPAGEFLMGSNKYQNKAHDNELPQHRLYLPTYRISRTPVTVDQFAAFVKVAGYITFAEKNGWAHKWSGSGWEAVHGANWRKPQGLNSNLKERGQHPVTCVSWYDAQAYCSWLSREIRQDIRLPTEAEWEKAARGQDGHIYPWGNEEPSESHCNFHMIVGNTSPIDQYPLGSSPYGCLDMVGNVWEWTQTLYGQADCKPEFTYPYNADDGRENTNAPGTICRVLRGGSFFDSPDNVRCAVRHGDLPFYCPDDAGFRLVISHL